MLDKYFKDKMCYFRPCDTHFNLEGDTYLSYRIINSMVELTMGSDNGEMIICMSDNVERIEAIVKNIIR